MTVQFHPLVTGEADKYVDLIKEKGLFQKKLGQKGKLQTIPLDKVRDVEANRDTKSDWAYKMIVKEGGVNEDIMHPISVTLGDDGFYYCYDGLGRTAIHQMAGFETIDAYVSEGNEEQSAERFIKMNKENKRTVDPESLFGAGLVAGRPEQVKEDKALKKIGLRVKVRSNKFYGSTKSTDPHVRVRALRAALKYSQGDLEVCAMARDIIVNAYPNDEKLRDDFYVGMVILLSTFDVLRRPGAPFDQLQTYIATHASMCDQIKLPFKKEGGNQHNAEFESVAYGLLRLFTNSKICNVSDNLRHKTLVDKFDNLTPIKKG